MADLHEGSRRPLVGQPRDAGRRDRGFRDYTAPSEDWSTLHGAVEAGERETNETEPWTQPGF